MRARARVYDKHIIYLIYQLYETPHASKINGLRRLMARVIKERAEECF